MVAKDIPPVLEFNEAAGWDEKRFYKSIYDDDKNSDILEIEFGGSFCRIGFVVWRSLEHKIELLNFCVRPEFRGHKYGTSLIDRVIYKSTPEQTRVSFVANERDDGVIRFLVKYGFKGGAVVKDAYGKGIDGWTMFYKKPARK